jgi:uncharacterized protein with FMN-binding domain
MAQSKKIKKFLLSLAVIMTFAAYSFSKKGSADPPVLPKVGANFTPSPSSSSPTPTKSPSTGDNAVSRATNTPSPTKSPNPTAVRTPTPTPIPTSVPAQDNGLYRDGIYTGNVEDAYYGNVQVRVTISGGKIANVEFLDYPQDRRTSVQINSQAMPYLISEAIQTQSSQVDIVSGATDTSMAFIQSLASALAQAQK